MSHYILPAIACRQELIGSSTRQSSDEWLSNTQEETESLMTACLMFNRENKSQHGTGRMVFLLIKSIRDLQHLWFWRLSNSSINHRFGRLKPHPLVTCWIGLWAWRWAYSFFCRCVWLWGKLSCAITTIVQMLARYIFMQDSTLILRR